MKNKRIKQYMVRKTIKIKHLRIWINFSKLTKNFELVVGIKKGFE